ncbi:hypothetical protein BUE76_09895 [Cnuella takakiae]|nr:hypothetical protein BUE76_09895 [Cnuella takakiae]
MSVTINLGVMELDGEEPRRAIISLEMLESGNYFSPTQFGWLYYNKPAFFNWILIAFIRLFGNASEFVLRLPSLLFYLLWAAIHYRFSCRFMDKGLALLSAFMLLTSADIYFYGLANGAEIDIFYSFVVYLQVIAIFHYYQQRQWSMLYLVSYLLCAIGFLTKGFPSLLFEGLTLTALCIYNRSLKAVLRWQHVAGAMIFIIVCGAYLWAFSLKGDEVYLLANLLNESVAKSAVGVRSNRVLEKSVAYPFLLLKLVAPWSLLLLLLFNQSVRRMAFQNAWVRFSVLFIACNIWVYWLTGQPKARYVYIFAPFASVVFVTLLRSWAQTKPALVNKVLKYPGWIFLIATAGVLALPFITATALWLAIPVALLLGAFTWFYFQVRAALRLWLFIAGIILLRLTYAVVLIPILHRAKAYYQTPMAEVAAKFGNGPLTYYAPPEKLAVQAFYRYLPVSSDTVLTPKHIVSQLSYYYYRNTGQLMRYDTVQRAGANMVSYAEDLKANGFVVIKQMGPKREPGTLVFYRLDLTK